MARARRHVEESAILVDGPWVHRDVSANGIRMHVVELGTGPLVLLVHGFPGFWWSWRHQLIGLAEAGYRAVACDLRGYGATDKPPRGYDAMTVAADIAGLVRALGETDGVIVGHDWGAHIGWTMAALHPDVVRRFVAVSAPHPLRWLPALASDGTQRRASRHVLRFQLPWHPERWLVADNAANVALLLRRWSGPRHAFGADEQRYRDAMLVLNTPHCALEYYRWAVRSVPRSDGRRFRRAVHRQLDTPTLQLHGASDPCVLPATAQGSGKYVSGPYVWRLLDDVGHFPAEECPELVTGEIVQWAKE